MKIKNIIWSKFRVKKKEKNKRKKTDEDFVLADCTIDIRSLNQNNSEQISLFAEEVALRYRQAEHCKNYYIGDIKILVLTSYCLEGEGTVNNKGELCPVCFHAEF